MLCRVRGYELNHMFSARPGKLYLATKRSTRAEHQLQDTHFMNHLI